MIFDEADRMLDLGFEREMNQCLDLIKQKCPGKFLQNEPEIENMKDKEQRVKVQKLLSKDMHINFVSATMNQRVESLG